MKHKTALGQQLEDVSEKLKKLQHTSLSERVMNLAGEVDYEITELEKELKEVYDELQHARSGGADWIP